MAEELTVEALVEAERPRWGELMALYSSLSPEQVRRPGYFEEGWSAKDLLAHLAGWLAEAGLVVEQIRSRTYLAKEMDVEAMNAAFLEANRDQPITIVEAQAHAARQRLLAVVRGLDDISDEAARWLRKAGPDHYDEHLPRLREWVKEVRAG
ncbi:MAG: ClbS/DfsB family four-helix bundle protein [Actinomycetota bacterium]